MDKRVKDTFVAAFCFVTSASSRPGTPLNWIESNGFGIVLPIAIIIGRDCIYSFHPLWSNTFLFYVYYWMLLMLLVSFLLCCSWVDMNLKRCDKNLPSSKYFYDLQGFFIKIIIGWWFFMLQRYEVDVYWVRFMTVN